MANLYKSVWSGKSVLRTLINQEFASIALTGSVLDVGGTKNPAPSYMEVLKIDGAVTVVNIDAGAHPDVMCDASAIPLPDGSFDNVLCFNLLEHVAEPEKVMSEISRLLRPGGRLFVETPFLVKVHGHPEDYQRFTDTALKKMAHDVGLKVTTVKLLGGGPFLAAAAQAQPVVPKLLFIPVLWKVRMFDAIVKKFRPQFMTGWPLGYIMECTKP
jgi:SAM-dependent methyltransferase